MTTTAAFHIKNTMICTVSMIILIKSNLIAVSLLEEEAILITMKTIKL